MSKLMTIDEVSAKTRLPVATLRWHRHCGTGPRSAKVGRRVVYREQDVEDWIEAQFAASASDRDTA